MQTFEGYKGISPEERYRNELMDHARKQTQLLEQIAQLLQPNKSEPEQPPVKRNYQRRKKT